MRIGILETGLVNPALLERHGPYAPMFERLLHSVDASIEVFTVSTVRGEEPEGTAAADGWIVTGSRHGAYEDHPWIAPLEAFLRACVADGVPVVGVCFGHQILAQALGGEVVKSEKGWGLGVQRYEAVTAPSWMTGFDGGFTGLAVHQDQVTRLPEGATVLAGSGFCPYASLAYGDTEAPAAISVQPHPEFDKAFVEGIISTRRGDGIPTGDADTALGTLDQPVDNALWARWIVEYFKRMA